MTVKVLGPLDTGTEHTLSPRERVVLTALIVLAGRSVAVGELAEAYWGAALPRTWTQQIKTSVARIRAYLGHDAVTTRGSEYSLGLDPATIDAFEFERLVSDARKHAIHDENDRAVAAYRRALAMWRGAPYPELADWEPATVEAERLVEIRRSVEEELLESRLAEGEHSAVVADAERLVRESPLRENRWAILAIANYRAGRQAEALSSIRSARARLADDLGIDPGDRLRALESSMLQHDPALVAAKPLHHVSDVCPYRGLQPFSSADTEDFFGRDADIDAMRQRVRDGSLTVVVGASGSGKSSLVLAGLLPRIADGRRIAVITAGRDAATDLRARIDAGGRADIVVVDQAEAILQLPERERDELCRILAEVLVGGSTVLMTLRSDFLDRATGLPRIGALIGRGVYAIGPLDSEGLREAIERPAARAGLRLEPGLVELIVRDAADRRTTLPHVSHALEETWVRREGATLTVAGYEASGGITGAIAQSAETLYRSLDAHSAGACRSLMLRLVHRGADGASVRRTASLAPLVADPAWRAVLDRLVAARLLTTDGDEVTVAHEALATAWPRLDQWLEEDAEGARLVATVAAAAELWDGSGRRNDDLLRGARLQAALDWRDGSEPALTTVEREFLDASAEQERDEIRELAGRAARDKRINRWLRWAMAGAGVLLVAAIFGGGLAAVRGGEAGRAAEDARIEALVATSLSLIDNDRETAALLAAETYRRWPDDPRTRSALWGVMTSTAGLVDTHHDEGAVFPSMDMLPGTGTALHVSSGRDRPDQPAVEVVDVATGDVVRTFDLGLPDAPPAWGRAVEVSADGSVAAIQSPVYPDPSNTDECCWIHLTFVDLRTGQPLPSTGLIRSQLSPTMTFDAAGRTLYVAQPVTADIIAVDTTTGEVRSSAPTFDDHPKGIENFYGVTLVDDGLLAVGAGDHLRLYDRATLALTRTIPLEGDVSSMDVIADGRGGIETTGWDGTVRVSLATGETLWRRFPDPTRNCYSLHLATDTTMACGSYEGVALVDLATGETSRAHAALQLNELPRFERIDDRTLLVAVSRPPTWMRWRIDGGGTGSDVIAKGRELVDGPEAGGSLVVTQPVGGGGRMQLWDLKRDAPVGEEEDRIVPLGSGVVAKYPHYDSEQQSGEPRLERQSTGERIPLRIPGLPRSFTVLPGGWDRPAFAWWPEGIAAFDPSTGKPLGPVMRVPDIRFSVLSVSETPGSALAVVTWSVDPGHSETGVFDISTGQLLVRGLHDLDSSYALDGDQLIGVAADYARRYDIHTLKPISALARAIGGSQLTSVSTDGRTLLNVGFNNALTLYDLTADIALATPVDSDAPGVRLRGGYLTADGETLLEALPDGIRIWDLRPAEQASQACALAGRELTKEEWSTYFPGEERVDTCAALTS
ncbi:BTAD domain-containing putative transcriptional regulator [Leifsonia sp. fls2-241-R2A-40a]|uniref:nSTAND1 domain-containing NTPase n=1 Tax=Leifsonia sp. fls2-241-R2A-40a TaxID=3040290 RepID=UPI00254D2B24|nr:BTAD domain-containing putative transcriptional regulator [Leifsonia sp. fls2-241-R2A-40a]